MRVFKNLTGLTIGNVTVLELLTERINNNLAYKCQCICGKIIIKQNVRLLAKAFSGHCGCKRNENIIKGVLKLKQENLTGKQFGKLTVLNLSEPIKGKTIWKCKCECGSIIDVRANSLKRGNTKSCNCLQKEIHLKRITKHNLTKTKEHRTWSGIKQRCYNIKNPEYKNYGGRGIKVCDRWLESFDNFLEDMDLAPSQKYSIERVDFNKNYCPENCIWIENKWQTRNTRRNVLNLDLAERIRILYRENVNGPSIKRILNQEGVNVSINAVYAVINNKTWVP